MESNEPQQNINNSVPISKFYSELALYLRKEEAFYFILYLGFGSWDPESRLILLAL